MRDREDLEQRVAELEREVVRLRGRPFRCVRWRSAATFMDVPLVAVATGPDLERGEMRGHARGIVALGDIATGVLALGGIARGLVAFGGVALGGVTFGGLSLGALVAIGGMAIGGFALGGGAAGGVAIGGGAVGYYACGGGAAGHAVVSAVRRDPEAVEFFRERGLGGVCMPSRTRY
jgi:hypothetical protein